jgi:hypothetical protein
VEQQLLDKRSRYAELEKQYIDEARIVTVGPRALAVKAQMESVANEIERLESNPDYLRIRRAKEDIEIERKKKLDESDKVAAGLDGLLERIKLAHEIAGWVISSFITLLFMAIELTPIFFKLMLIKSPYDYLEENVKELIKAEHAIEITPEFYQDKDGHERDKVTNHQVIRLLKEKIKLLESQSQLSEQAIESWKKKKMADVSSNPEEFIVEQNTN